MATPEVSAVPRPVYSEVMEDYSVISGALAITGDDVAVAVASGGDNVFHAVLDGARSVYAVDINPVQIDFCRLKEAALRDLDAGEIHQLAGVTEASPDHRRALFSRLSLPSSLDSYRSPPVLAELVEPGLLNTGQLTAFVAPLREGLWDLVGRETVERIFTGGTAERRRIWEESFATPAVEEFLALCLNQETISDSFIPGWAFDRMAARPFHRFYHGVLRHQLVELEPSRNYFMHRLWLGRYVSPDCVPPYLEASRLQQVRAGLERISWHAADMLDFLGTLPPRSVDAFNLSNILDWSPDEHYRSLWEAVDRVAAPGARLFLRSFLSERPVPEEVARRWRCAAERGPEMAARDRVGYYSRYELWVRS